MGQPANRAIFQIREGSDKKVNNQQSRENYIPGYKKPSHGHNHTKCRYPDPVFIHTLFRYGTYHLFELYHGFYFKSVHLYDDEDTNSLHCSSSQQNYSAVATCKLLNPFL